MDPLDGLVLHLTDISKLLLGVIFLVRATLARRDVLQLAARCVVHVSN